MQLRNMTQAFLRDVRVIPVVLAAAGKSHEVQHLGHDS